MEEIAKYVAEYGILTVIAGVFIWDKIKNMQTTENILRELHQSSQLQGSTLESLRHTTENQTTLLGIINATLAADLEAMKRHDTRAEFMNNDVKVILELVKTTLELIKASPCGKNTGIGG